MVAEREAKSVSQEGTYDTDLTDRTLMEHLLTRQAGDVAARLRKHGLSGPHRHDQGPAARLHDPQPLDDAAVAHRPRRRRSPAWPAALLADLDTSGGVRLLGVGVSGLADWVQEDLFGETTDAEDDEEPQRAPRAAAAPRRPPAPLGARHGRGARRRWAGAGCGARAAGWSRCASRPPRRRPGRSGRTPRTTLQLAAVGSASHPLKRREPARAVALDRPLADPQLASRSRGR